MSHGLALQSVFKTPASGGPPNEATEGLAITATHYSLPTEKSRLPWFSYDMYWPATLTATITVQVSNKPNPILTSDADWKTATLAVPITQPNGATTGDTIDLSDLPFRWVRLKVVFSAGSGTMFAYVAGMGA